MNNQKKKIAQMSTSKEIISLVILGISFKICITTVDLHNLSNALGTSNKRVNFQTSSIVFLNSEFH